MSCFGGRMREYRFISIDRFDGDNLLSRIFFLSHCHEDHMTGLDSKRFHNHLVANNLRLHVQGVTYELLLHDSRFRHLEPHLVKMEVDRPYMYPVPNDTCKKDEESDTITVTLLSAGHCPGSVMFLFEGSEGNVLYTGDIRLDRNDLENMESLYAGSRVKSIRSVYFDSTFCTYDTVNIVDRKESVRAIADLVQNHLRENSKNQVLLYCAAKYGHEFLMCKLSERLGMKVHVSGSKRALYEKIPGIKPHVTDDGKSTRIHACAFYDMEDDWQRLNGHGPKKAIKGGRNLLYSIPCCPDCRAWESSVIVIKPSMLWFQQSRSIRDTMYYDEKNAVYRVQYSCHSSLSEIRDLLRHIQPQNAYPNVVPFRSKDYKPVYDAVRDLVPSMAHSSPSKFNSIQYLSASPTKRGGGECSSKSKETTTTFVSGRKRYIESVLAKDRKKQKREEKKKTRPPAETWDALFASDESETDSDDDNGETSHAADRSSQSSSDSRSSISSESSSYSVGEDSQLMAAIDSDVHETGASVNDFVALGPESQLMIPVEENVREETNVEVVQLTDDAPVDEDERRSTSPASMILHLSDSSVDSPRPTRLAADNDGGLDSDVDLFDLPPSNEDEDEDADDERLEKQDIDERKEILEDEEEKKIRDKTDDPIGESFVERQGDRTNDQCDETKEDHREEMAAVRNEKTVVRMESEERSGYLTQTILHGRREELTTSTVLQDQTAATPVPLTMSDSLEFICVYNKKEHVPLVTIESGDESEATDEPTKDNAPAFSVVFEKTSPAKAAATTGTANSPDSKSSRDSSYSRTERATIPKSTNRRRLSPIATTSAADESKPASKSTTRTQRASTSTGGRSVGATDATSASTSASSSTSPKKRPRQKTTKSADGRWIIRVLDETDEQYEWLMANRKKS